MGRKKESQQLKIYSNNILIGELTQSPGREIIFQYANSWLVHAKSRPISLQFPLRQKAYRGAKVEYYFDNLLPDNEEIRKRIQDRVGSDSIRSFDLLSAIGKDCVGALQFVGELPLAKSGIDSIHLSDKQISNMLKNYQTIPLGMDLESDFRISLAGAQEKTALLKYKGHWCRPAGTTATTHILKLPIGFIQNNGLDLSESVENEWLCHLIVKAFGLPVANAEITQFDDSKVLVVERFDRQWINNKKNLIRLPQEDMCQALGHPSGRKYQKDQGPGIVEIMKLLLGSDNQLDREIFFKTQIIYWLLAAPDGHAKNFSLFLKPQGHYQMTPLYDILSVFPNITPRPVKTKNGKTVNRRDLQTQKVKMAMALIGKERHYHWSHMTTRYFFSTAKKCDFPKGRVQAILDEIIETGPSLIESVSELIPKGFPHHISDSILYGLMRSIKQISSS